MTIRAARAQAELPPPLSWARTFDLNGRRDNVRKVTLDKSGNAIVIATTYASEDDCDWLVLKYSAQGALVWQRVYGAAGHFDIPEAVVADGAGDIVVVGEAWTNATDKQDIEAIKFAAGDGATLWDFKRDYNNNDDYVSDVAVDGANNVYLVATGAYSATDTDLLAWRILTATGAASWRGKFATNYQEFGTALTVAGDGSAVYVAGQTDTRAGANANPSLDAVTIRFAGATGAVVWSKPYDYGGDYDEAKDIALDASGANVYTLATGVSGGGADQDAVLLRYNAATGAAIVAKPYRYTPAATDFPAALCVDALTGGVFFAEYAEYTEPDGVGGVVYRYAVVTAKFNPATNNIEWVKAETYRNGLNAAMGISNDNAGGIYTIATGVKTENAPPQDSDANAVVWKYAASDGALQWAISRSSAPGAGYDTGAAVAVNPRSKDVFVAGDGDTNAANDVSPPDVALSRYVQPSLRPLFIAQGGGDGKTRLVWRGTEPVGKTFTLWTVGGTGAVEAGKKYGVPAGYSLVKIAVGSSDNKIRLLLRRDATNAAVLWTFSANLQTLEKGVVFAPVGYKPVDVAISVSDNKIRLLWSNATDNRAALWTLNAAGSAPEAGRLFAPPAAAPVLSGLAVGSGDNRVRLLWRAPSGNSGVLQTLNAAGTTVASSLVIAETGYGAPVLFASPLGSDNLPRVLWTRTDGAVRLVTYAASGAGTIGTAYNYGPYAGASAVGLSINPADNKPHFLWGYADGRMALWRINGQTGVIETGYLYGPYY